MHPSPAHPALRTTRENRVDTAKRRYQAALHHCGGWVVITSEESGPFCFGIARVHNGGNELGSRKCKKTSKTSEFDTVIKQAVAQLLDEGAIVIINDAGTLKLWLSVSYQRSQASNKGPLPGYRRGDRRRKWRQVVAAMKAA